jgi:integrase
MKPSPHSFTVREGIAKMRVWRHFTRRAGKVYPCWEFQWHEDGRRKTCNRADRDEARAEARAVAKRIADGAGGVWTSQETAAFRAVKENLFGCNVTPQVASYEYRKARELLSSIGRDDLVEAVHFFVKNHHGGVADRSLADVVRELVDVRTRDGCSRRHLKDLRSRLGRFAKDMNCRLADCSGVVIDAWVRALDIENRTRRNYRGALVNLFKFARDRGYVPETFNPMKAIPVPKSAKAKKGVFKPEAMKRLLSHASTTLLPVLAIGSFAGLRQSEVLLMDWEDVDWVAGRIRVPEGKTGSRWAPMHDNLRAWLEPLRGQGRLVPVGESAVTKAIERCVNNANRELASQSARWRITWPHNGPRHSYGSYRCALTRNVELVADEMGHSIRELSRSYRNQRVTPEEAEAWFALRPERASNVLEFDFGDRARPMATKKFR